MSFVEAQIRGLSAEGMILLYEDVVSRIGSHMISDEPDKQYIQKQKEIIRLIQEEFERRKI